MSKTLYFAKININSESTFKILKGQETVEKIMSKLSDKIQNNIKYTYTIENVVKGETITKTQEFSFTGINKVEIDSELMIVGGVVKTAKVNINNINKTTGEKVTQSFDSDEVVNFCFYPKKEIVAYYCAQKFGHTTFVYAFEGLINKAFTKENFKVSKLTNGVSLDDIKGSLQRIKNIKTLQIDIIPPNPPRDIIEKLEAYGEIKIKSYESGRITERSTIFKSSYGTGLDTTSEEISKELDDATAIHSKISVETATKNGYVSVLAINDKGTEYNTNTEKAVKQRMSDSIVGDNSFAKFIKGIIEKIF